MLGRPLPGDERAIRLFIRDGGYDDQSVWTPDAFHWLRESSVTEPAFWRDTRFNAPRQPVTGVSFYEAAAFARWFGGRLPTEAEWEAAGRSPRGLTYLWGETSPDLRLANFAPDFVPRRRAPSRVGRFRGNVSPFGRREMSGNVFEWCADHYHFDTPKRRSGAGFVEDRPSGRRVLKGGAWTTDGDRIRVYPHDGPTRRACETTSSGSGRVAFDGQPPSV